jgi:hypothetical protein
LRVGAEKLRINRAGEVINETPCVKAGLGLETRQGASQFLAG